PENKEGVASGLLKMVTVGLGKQIGAQEAHTHGLWPSVEAVPKLSLEKAPILFGVAVVENAFRQPVNIEVIPPNYEAFREADDRTGIGSRSYRSGPLFFARLGPGAYLPNKEHRKPGPVLGFRGATA